MAVLALDIVADADLGVEELLVESGAVEECSVVSLGSPVIVVDGEVIHQRVAFLQGYPLPVGIACKQGRRGTADADLEVGIHVFEDLGDFIRLDAVCLGILFKRIDLPGTVHLVAEVPCPDIVRLGVAVLLSQVGPVGAAFEVGVLHAADGAVDVPGAEVERIQRFCAGFCGPLKVLVMSELIGFELFPGQIQVSFSVFPGAYGVSPVPAGHEVASRKSYRGHSELLYGIKDVGPEALLIRARVVGAVYASVYPVADGLKECAEQLALDPADLIGGIDGYFCFLCHFFAPAYETMWIV